MKQRYKDLKASFEKGEKEEIELPEWWSEEDLTRAKEIYDQAPNAQTEEKALLGFKSAGEAVLTVYKEVFEIYKKERDSNIEVAIKRRNQPAEEAKTQKEVVPKFDEIMSASQSLSIESLTKSSTYIDICGILAVLVYSSYLMESCMVWVDLSGLVTSP